MMNPTVAGYRKRAFLYDAAQTFLQGTVCSFDNTDPDKGIMVLADADVALHLSGDLYYCWTPSDRLDVIESERITCLMAPCVVKMNTDGYKPNVLLVENTPLKLGSTTNGCPGKLELWESGVDDPDLIVGYVEVKPDSTGVMHVRLVR